MQLELGEVGGQHNLTSSPSCEMKNRRAEMCAAYCTMCAGPTLSKVLKKTPMTCAIVLESSIESVLLTDKS